MGLFDRATYVASAHDLEQLPPDVGAEVAFVGRSNAGKSSAINTLANHKRLAYVSKTPGRTQLINFFSLGDDRTLVPPSSLSDLARLLFFAVVADAH